MTGRGENNDEDSLPPLSLSLSLLRALPLSNLRLYSRSIFLSLSVSLVRLRSTEVYPWNILTD